MDRRLLAACLLALLVEAWVLLSDFHFLWKPPRVPSGATRIARVQSIARQAKGRSSLQLNWFDLSPGQELFEGDEVATMDRSEAVIKFEDGQTVKLEPNSFLVLRESGFGADHAFQISLVRGGLHQEKTELAADASLARSRLEIEVGGRKVVSRGQADVTVESGTSGRPEIAVGGGNVSVTEVGPKGIEIGRPSAQLLSGGAGAPVREVKPPALLAPAEDAVLVNRDSVRLKWEQLDTVQAPTLIEVSREADFKTLVWHAILSGEQAVDFTPEHKGRYYWRATRLGVRQEPSRVASFEVRRELSAPTLQRPKIEHGGAARVQHVDAPELSKPVIHYQRESLRRPLPQGAPLRPPRFAAARRAALRVLAAADAWLGGENARAEEPENTRYVVDLSWSGVRDAAAYVLQIATDSDFQHVVAEKVLTWTAFSWHTDNAGFYYWRVSGVDKDGDRGPFSEFNTFSIKAERNQPGDVTSYETFLQFDEYSKYTNNLRFIWGPTFDRYYYSGIDNPFNPPSVVYASHSLINGQIAYDYRLNPYYSLQASLKVERSQIGASDYESRPDQGTLNQYETQINIGAARRVFFPRHYFSLYAGVRATFIDIPIDDGQDDNQVEFTDFAFFGAYGAVGYTHLFGEKYDGTVTLGAAFQSSGDSWRATQSASIEARRQLTEFIHLGLRLDEILVAYRFGSTLLSGQAHSLSWRPAVTVDWSF